MKFLYIFVALCVLFASTMAAVLPTGDEPEVSSGQVRAKCDLRACEQFCRRLGYPGGACINDKCDCDRW